MSFPGILASELTAEMVRQVQRKNGDALRSPEPVDRQTKATNGRQQDCNSGVRCSRGNTKAEERPLVAGALKPSSEGHAPACDPTVIL